MKTLATIQKKAIRIIHNSKYNAHTSELFRESKITKIENIFEKESIIFIHKYKNNSLPLETQKLINESLQLNRIGTRSRTSIDLRPDRRLSKGDLIYDIIENWNTFDYSDKETVKISALKKKINDIQNKITVCNQENCYACKTNN